MTDSIPSREEIARIVDPEAFKLRKPINKSRPGAYNPGQLGWQMVALSKADSILSLLSQREGEMGSSGAESTDARRFATATEEVAKRLTCATCKHFTPESSGFGSCAKWHRGYGVLLEDMAINEVLVEDDEGWGMLVGPCFGCILHTPADPDADSPSEASASAPPPENGDRTSGGGESS
jgi:hypothetical protein